ncbi:MAG: hypothetical protein KatS3mg024_1933 [Armatimonadota bacterium]|nr:MAG: hypothetical protein KatS3mg024_1933 [Armatimonadota bacterium]
MTTSIPGVSGSRVTGKRLRNRRESEYTERGCIGRRPGEVPAPAADVSADACPESRSHFALRS